MTIEAGYREPLVLTDEQLDLIDRRTEWIKSDFVRFNRSLRLTVRLAYIAGMNDAAQVADNPDTINLEEIEVAIDRLEVAHAIIKLCRRQIVAAIRALAEPPAGGKP